MTSPIDRAANSSAMQVLSRLAMLAMPVVIPLMGWLGLQYLDQRFAEIRTVAVEAAGQASSLAATNVTAADNAGHLNARVDVIEANMATGTADRDAFQRRTTQQIDKLTDLATTTSNQVSSLTATIWALRRDQSSIAP